MVYEGKSYKNWMITRGTFRKPPNGWRVDPFTPLLVDLDSGASDLDLRNC